MLSIIARAMLALLGAGALFTAASAWYDPEAVGAGLCLAAVGELGLATLRGDIGTLFGSSGAFMLAAAALGDRRLIVVPLIFTGVGLTGRTLSLAVGEYAPALVPPMLVEAITIVVLVAAYVMLERATTAAPAAAAPSEPASAA